MNPQESVDRDLPTNTYGHAMSILTLAFNSTPLGQARAELRTAKDPKYDRLLTIERMLLHKCGPNQDETMTPEDSALLHEYEVILGATQPTTSERVGSTLSRMGSAVSEFARSLFRRKPRVPDTQTV